MSNNNGIAAAVAQQIIPPAQADGVEIEERDGIYVKRQGTTYKHLSNFVLQPQQLLQLDDGDERLAAVAVAVSGEEAMLHIPKGAWSSQAAIRGLLPWGFAMWADGEELQRIKALLSADLVPVQRATRVAGRHGDEFIAPGCCLGPNGQVSQPQTKLVQPRTWVVEQVRYVDDGRPPSEQALIALRYLLPEVNEPRVTIPFIGWFFATPFAPLIRDRLGHFPILNAFGTTGSGKTSLTALMCHLLGVYSSEGWSCVQTEFTLIDRLASVNAMPVWMGEFKPATMGHEVKNRICQILRENYDGMSRARGREDLTATSFPLVAPVVLDGEQPVAKFDTALPQRVLPAKMSPLGQQREVWAQLQAIQREGHLDKVAYSFVRWSFKEDLDQLLAAANELLPYSRDDLPPRQYDNLLIAAIGLLSWSNFTLWLASVYGHALDDIDVDLVHQGLKEVYEGRNRSEDVSPGLTGLIQLLDTMAGTDRLEASLHYRREGDLLYLRVPVAVAKVHEYLAWTKQPGTEMLDADTYREQASDNHKAEGYVVDPSRPFRLDAKKSPERCIVVDLTRLPFETSGFASALAAL